jgi:hypothetical protein
VTATLGPATPVWNGTAYQYVTGYTIPTSATNVSNNGDKYRVIVATTSANLSNANCQFTDGVSIITVNIIDCLIPLKVSMISFNGKIINHYSKLSWTAIEEVSNVSYRIEKSYDGEHFETAGSVTGNGGGNNINNTYEWFDPELMNGRRWYRILMIDPDGNKKYSNVIELSDIQSTFVLGSVVNPFSRELKFDLSTPEDIYIKVELVDMSGNIVKQRNYLVYKGQNTMTLPGTGDLATGTYVLSIRYKDKLFNRVVMKR